MSLGAGPASVLLVEDDSVDAEGVVRGFREGGISVKIRRAVDGIEALKYLRSEPGTERSPDRPCLVLLDLNMPRMGGLEMLAELRRDPALADTVVIVLTTSGAERDRFCAQGLGVAGYFVKSGLFDGFAELTTLISSIEFPASPTIESNA